MKALQTPNPNFAINLISLIGIKWFKGKLIDFNVTHNPSENIYEQWNQWTLLQLAWTSTALLFVQCFSFPSSIIIKHQSYVLEENAVGCVPMRCVSRMDLVWNRNLSTEIDYRVLWRHLFSSTDSLSEGTYYFRFDYRRSIDIGLLAMRASS